MNLAFITRNVDQLYYQRHTPHGLENLVPVSSSTMYILKQAEKIGMQISNVPGTKLFKLKYKTIERTFYAQVPPSTSNNAIYTSEDKRITLNLLNSAGISTPKGYALTPKDSQCYRKEVFDSLKKPLVVKPGNGAHGKYVYVDINEFTSFNRYVQKIFNNLSIFAEKWVIVEEMLFMKEYRILVTQNKVLGIINRIPANVIGNGRSTIGQLIKEKNLDPRRGDPENHPPLFRIQIDENLKEFLKKQGLNLSSVPSKNVQIFLNGVSNISQGGDSIDCTDIAHSTVKELAIKAINAIPGLDLAGVDLMTKDITKKQTQDSYAILEVNTSPGLDIHDSPYIGKCRNVCLEFLKLMFPELENDLNHSEN